MGQDIEIQFWVNQGGTNHNYRHLGL